MLKLWQYLRLLHQNQSFLRVLKLVRFGALRERDREREACGLSLHGGDLRVKKRTSEFGEAFLFFTTTFVFCFLVVGGRTNKILGICKLKFSFLWTERHIKMLKLTSQSDVSSTSM